MRILKKVVANDPTSASLHSNVSYSQLAYRVFTTATCFMPSVDFQMISKIKSTLMTAP